MKEIIMKLFKFALIFLLVVGCKKSVDQPEALATPEKEASALLKTFRYGNDKLPKISVHRGGKGLVNYPENCLETLKYVNDSIYAVYEIDVAQTKDSVLVLMHDNSIDRTTTGTGRLSDFTYAELLQLNLRDDYGNVTDFKISTFEDVLNWSKTNNVVLTVDIKRSVSQETVINAIRKAEAEDTSIIITYDLEQSQSAYELAPELMLSVSARNMKEFQWLMDSGIPTENMIAFTGTRLSDKALFDALHDKGILTMLGSLGNLDKSAEANGNEFYNKWFALGIDVMATDRPFAVAEALKIKN
ncbi:glycerophosphodiester phosphodiesterase family protein [Winogradskyella maritima]|uniref:Glycerophosphodiester phosphodiesterase family protein n=1 Tax=Winogradskyella maritima TaxID=1517766 RepID=A0ABV8ACD8_9FLAO|nr:glycerophosphodiester phosphodiesterase family protein [Winogradskyella maritima]